MADLLGEEPAVTTKRKRAKPKSEADPVGGRLVARWIDGYTRKFGLKADPRQIGRLGKEIKQLAASWGETEVESLIDRFFSTTEPAVVRSDYSPAAFLALVPRLRINGANGRGLAERTQENVHAATRAMERRK